jgi:hypothetical protein
MKLTTWKNMFKVQNIQVAMITKDRCFWGVGVQPVHEADNLTAIFETII